MSRVCNLTSHEAAERASRVSGVRYELSLALPLAGDSYRATCRVEFRLDENRPPATASAPLFVDLSAGAALETLELNGAPLDVPQSRAASECRLSLGSAAARGPNVLTCAYVSRFDRDGSGLHAFDDPEDGRRYVYTDLEPNYAQRVLPCFDQPDVKARLRLSVRAPRAWAVVANAPEERAEEAGEGELLHVFRETAPISTYLFAVMAGEWARAEGEYEGRAGRRVRTSVMCRASLREALGRESAEFLELTRLGLGFYEEFFGVEYPFDKYDQICCPEYNHGAMENAGAVTFSESYVYRERATEQQRTRRADTLLHEMAHMWFGDLVTPVWWDGLWLNESFASYMSALALSSLKHPLAKNAWGELLRGMKEHAYAEDQMTTTHPIQTPVPDTDSTFQNFDWITYGKGASVLKQMVFVVGTDAFREGLRLYFGKHKWGNTSIADFVAAINAGTQKVSGHGLPDGWIEQWLSLAGLNTLETSVASEGGVVKSVRLRQTAPKEHPTLRSHRTLVGVFDYSAGAVTLRRKAAVTVEPREETDIGQQLGIVGETVPALVWPNLDDHAYAKVVLDEHSLGFCLEHISEMPDGLTRMQLWSTLYSMVRDAHLVSPEQFIRSVLRHLPSESLPDVVAGALVNVRACIRCFLPSSRQPAMALEAFNAAMSVVRAAEAAAGPVGVIGDCAIVWARQSVLWSHYSRESTAALFELAQSASSARWVDQDMRWTAVQNACAWGFERASDAMHAETKRDPSDRGTRAAIKCRSSVFDVASKSQSWARYLDDKCTWSLHEIEADMDGFWWPHQHEQLRSYADEFFPSVRQVFRTRPHQFCESFFEVLAPWAPEDDKIHAQAVALLGSLGPEDHVLVRTLREWLDNVDRSRRVLQHWRSS
eukprot:m51a1_g4158 hypothetical protein (884) ;mRNA; f:261359-264068